MNTMNNMNVMKASGGATTAGECSESSPSKLSAELQNNIFELVLIDRHQV